MVWDENDFEAGTATSLCVLVYIPQLTSWAISDPTTLIMPMVNKPCFLHNFSAEKTSLVSPDCEMKMAPPFS